MTDTREEALKCVPCIHYPVWFKKNADKTPMQALIDSGSEVNAIHPSFTKQLGFPIRPIDIEAQKINGTMLNTHKMVVVAFSVVNKLYQVRFFEETFVVANISPKVVFGMSFFTWSGVNVDFLGREFQWKTYITKKALPTTRRVKLVDKKEFVATALNSEYEAYVVYVASLSSTSLASFGSIPLNVHPFWRPQIFGLIVKEALTKIPAKYSDFADVFSPDLASGLPKHTGINDYALQLVHEYQQPPYGPIYSLKPIELEILKTYIKTNLANGFIRLSKSLASAPILFDRKSNNFLQLCIDYRGLNNLIIKNRYLLPLIGELLDRLKRAKRFIQLDFTSAYHQMRIHKGDEGKIAFRTQYGHFKYQVMPFGQTNVPASFQRYINKILAEKLDIFVFVYLDDILI